MLTNLYRNSKLHIKLSVHEADLIRRCISGEEDAYTALYNKYAKHIYNSISRMLANSAEAEDIVQEAFCTAFEQIGRLKKQDNFEGWVKRIAINKTINLLKKRKLVFVEGAFYDQIADSVPDIEDEKLFQCKVEDVKAAIMDLPVGYRTIISLHLFENIPQDEIAKMLGVSHNTVRSQYHRAKKKVFLALKDTTAYGT